MRLFALRESAALGDAVAAGLGVTLDPAEERRFEDGEYKTRPLVSVRGKDVYIIESLCGDRTASANDRLCKLLFFAATCREQGAARVSVVAPYLCYARKDRQTKPRDPLTLKYVAQLFEAMGVARVLVVEVHNPAAFQNAFRVPTVNLSSLGLFYPVLTPFIGDAPLVILSPDAGGIKRAQLARERFERLSGRPVGLAIMEKRRSQDVVSGDLFAGDVDGKSVIIVDDLIASGATLLKAARASAERGAARIFAIAAHGYFSGGAAALMIDPAISHVLVTDSLQQAVLQQAAHGERLTIVSLGAALGEAIRRLHTEESITDLTDLEEPAAPVPPRGDS